MIMLLTTGHTKRHLNTCSTELNYPLKDFCTITPSGTIYNDYMLERYIPVIIEMYMPNALLKY